MATEFSSATELSTFRRIAAAMWRRPSDPTIYGAMDVDASAALRFLERRRAETGQRLTITHLVAQAVAGILARHPELNAKVRYWGKVEQRRSVDLFVSVATDGGRDLSGARIDGAERLTLLELAESVQSAARGIRAGSDRDYQKSRSLLGRVPWWLLRPLLWTTDLLSNELNLHLPGAGMPRDPFGSAIITNVGSFGIDTAFAPFLPLGRCPMLLLLSEIRPRPYVVGDRVEPRPVLRLCATFDHRIIDGHQAGLIARELRAALEAPETLEGSITQEAAEAVTTSPTAGSSVTGVSPRTGSLPGSRPFDPSSAAQAS